IHRPHLERSRYAAGAGLAFSMPELSKRFTRKAEYFRKPPRRGIMRAEGQRDNGDRNADESAEDTPQRTPSENGKERCERRQGDGFSRQPGFDHTSNDGLNDIKAYENGKHQLPARKVRERKGSNEERGDQRPQKRDEVENERSKAPGFSKWQPHEARQKPDKRTGRDAHQGPEQHVIPDFRRG